MKKSLSISVFLFLAIFAFSGHAYAKGIPVFFGEQESVHKIVDVPLKGGQGEDLFLGYKTHSYFLLAGIYINDDGYVIGISGNDKGYYPLPSGDRLKVFQTSGMLPKELPKYKISFFNYLIGYSLWILIFCVGVYFFSKSFSSKRVLQYEVKHKIKSTRKW